MATSDADGQRTCIDSAMRRTRCPPFPTPTPPKPLTPKVRLRNCVQWIFVCCQWLIRPFPLAP